MTTFTFIGSAKSQFVNWNDPTVWAGGVFPNSPTADVVFPTITTGGGSNYVSFPAISSGQSFSANSVSITNNEPQIAGSLSVTNAVSLMTGGEIDINGGVLSAGSLSLASSSIDIQGNGQIDVAGTISNDGSIIGEGLSVTSNEFDNAGSVLAASGNLTLVVSSGGFENLSGSTLTDGTYGAGFASNTSPNVLNLNIGGGLIATDAANIELKGGGSIQTFDNSVGQYVPLQSTLILIASTGTLSLADQTYNWGALTDDGTLALSGNALVFNSSQLTVGNNGMVSGTGKIVAPINNSGVITAGIGQSELLFPTETSEDGVLEIEGSVSGPGLLQIGAPDYSSDGAGFGLHIDYYFPTLELDGPVSSTVIFPSFTLTSPIIVGGTPNEIVAPATLILNDVNDFTGSIFAGTGADVVVSGVSYSSITGYSYSGNSASGTLTVQDGGSAITLNFLGDLNTEDFALSAGPQPLSSSPPSLSITVTASPTNPEPPSGTTADMFMSRSDGTYDIYDLGNNSILGVYYLGQIGPQWQVAGLGDFSGTDTADLMMRNSSTGAFEIYDISGNNIASNAVSVGQVGLEWSPVGFADFSNNANETDMLMRDTSTGAFELYDISNNSYSGFHSFGQVGPEWSVAGFGNFSGVAGETDMLMRNSNTGAFELYDINNNNYTGFFSMGQVGLEWSVMGIGDFSGNAGETDMLMRNSNTGAFELYDIRNNNYTGFFSMGQVGAEWSVVGFGDFSGVPNESDMLMRNSSGEFELFDINNNNYTGFHDIGNIATTSTVAAVGAYSTNTSGASSAQMAQAIASLASSGASNTTPIVASSNPGASQQSLLATPHPG